MFPLKHIARHQPEYSLLFKTQCYTHGQWHHAHNRTTVQVVSPVTQQRIGTVSGVAEQEMLAAVVVRPK